MKSVPTSCIKHTAQENEMQPLDIYNELFEGERMNFDLTEGGLNCGFKYDKDLSVRSYKPSVTKKKRIEGKTIEYEESEFNRCIGFSKAIKRTEVFTKWGKHFINDVTVN